VEWNPEAELVGWSWVVWFHRKFSFLDRKNTGSLFPTFWRAWENSEGLPQGRAWREYGRKGLPVLFSGREGKAEAEPPSDDDPASLQHLPKLHPRGAQAGVEGVRLDVVAFDQAASPDAFFEQ
jgi:hypothetical protein